MKQGAAFKGWTPEQIRSITAPTLIVLADRDIVTPEHAVAMFRLHRIANLAIVPGRDHFSIVDRPDGLNPTLLEFLDAPMPAPTK
jgi:pimeloyl-ACP methyl ester carboxylesterase